jgi:hypothetical protein
MAVLLALLLAAAAPSEAEDDLPPAASATVSTTRPQVPPIKPTHLYARLGADDLQAELDMRRKAGGPPSAKLERLTQGLVGAPYLLSPLGEGIPPDPDPTFRLDAFDCTTLVETAIALARTEKLADARALMDRIRYMDGKPSFGSRRHLMTSEWIPGLVKEGFVEDVTASVGGKRTRWIKLQLDDERWKKRRIAKTLALASSEIPRGTFPLPYIPISAVLDDPRRIPPGTILSVVRIDVPWSPDVITHQGLVLMKGKTRIVRHASPVAKRVIDEPLEHMMHRYLRPQPKGKRWPIAGIHLLRIVE